MKIKDLIKILEEFSPYSDVTIYNQQNPIRPIEIKCVEKTNRIFQYEDESEEVAILKPF